MPELARTQDRQPSVEAVSEEPYLGERFPIEGCIGRGGMGSVYRVTDETSGKRFAAKVLRAELLHDSEAIKRFEIEARAAASLDHPNIAAIYLNGRTEEGLPFIIMDLVDGVPLSDLVPEGFGRDRAIDICIQICDALEHAHSRGVIHRDLKPGNILIAFNNGIESVRIVDFGIARIEPDVERKTTDLTQTGDILGSPLYMSPEQCLGFGMDRRSDIYSLGCILYELLMGTPPFSAVNPVEVIAKHLSHDDVTLEQCINLGNRDVRTLAAVINKCLERDPANRYEQARDLRSDLEAVRAGEKPAALDRRLHLKTQMDLGSAVSIVVSILVALSFLILTNPGVLPIIQYTFVFFLVAVFSALCYPNNRITLRVMAWRTNWTTRIMTCFALISCFVFGLAVACFIFHRASLFVATRDVWVVAIAGIAVGVADALLLAIVIARRKWRILGWLIGWWIAHSTFIGVFLAHNLLALLHNEFDGLRLIFETASTLASRGLVSMLLSLPILFALFRLADRITPSGLVKLLRALGLIDLIELIQFDRK